jgi:NADH-quinone oxidoreductase subunit A
MGPFADMLAVLLVSGTAGLLLAGLGRARDPLRRCWSSTLPVLGGAAPPTHAWSRFHVRHYPMALLFIAFEMEMMFMYPWAVVYVREGLKALGEMGMFLGILSMGILYAWREGAFDWQ